MKGSFSDANLPAIGKSHFSRGLQYNNENTYSQEFNSGVEKQNSGIFFDAPLTKLGSNTTNLKEFLDCPQINRVTSEEKIFGSSFIISKIDRMGNYRRNLEQNKGQQGQKSKKQMEDEEFFRKQGFSRNEQRDPQEILRSDEDEKSKANAAKEFIEGLIKSANCTFIDAKKQVKHKGTYHMLYKAFLKKFKSRSMTEKLELVQELWKIHDRIKEPRCTKMGRRASQEKQQQSCTMMAKSNPNISKKDREALIEIVERNNEEIRALNFQMTDSDASKKPSRKSKPNYKGSDKAKKQENKDLKNIKEKPSENQTYFSQTEFISYLVKKYSHIAFLYKRYIDEGEKMMERVENDLQDFKTVCAFGKENQTIEKLEEKFGKYFEFREPVEKEEFTVLFTCYDEEITIQNFGFRKELYFRFFCYYPYYETQQVLELKQCNLTEEVLILLLEFLLAYCPELRVLKIIGCNFNLECSILLHKLLLKGKLETQTLKKCHLSSKSFGNVLLGIVQGNSLESINVKHNDIDDHGVIFLCNLQRYYEKLTFFNICENKYNAKGINELRRAQKFSKRFNGENAILDMK